MEQEPLHFESRPEIERVKAKLDEIRRQIHKVIIGQEEMIDLLLVTLLANGHVLIEGVPGVAKTITAKLLARTLEAEFSRIQFTPDLMPSDILGTSVFNIKNSEFEFKPGPVFSQIVLIDEINRSPAKTQAALFEVMEERQVTIDGHRYGMKEPFMVLATQNPIEQEGTYRLPEAQLDRFLFKIEVDYPTGEEEVQIISTHHERKNKSKLDEIQPVMTTAEVLEYRDITQNIRMEKALMEYIAGIVVQTREHPFLYLGASPRASLALMHASKGFALLEGRDFVTPDDVKKAALPVLRHRIIITPEREMEGIEAGQVIAQILENVEAPK